jgi:hypothetical protein
MKKKRKTLRICELRLEGVKIFVSQGQNVVIFISFTCLHKIAQVLVDLSCVNVLQLRSVGCILVDYTVVGIFTLNVLLALLSHGFVQESEIGEDEY